MRIVARCERDGGEEETEVALFMSNALLVTLSAGLKHLLSAACDVEFLLRSFRVLIVYSSYIQER